MMTNWFRSVLRQCWFGHLACKNVPEMTYYVLSGTLNPTHSLTVTDISLCEWVLWLARLIKEPTEEINYLGRGITEVFVDNRTVLRCPFVTSRTSSMSSTRCPLVGAIGRSKRRRQWLPESRRRAICRRWLTADGEEKHSDGHGHVDGKEDDEERVATSGQRSVVSDQRAVRLRGLCLPDTSVPQILRLIYGILATPCGGHFRLTLRLHLIPFDDAAPNCLRSSAVKMCCGFHTRV